MILLIYLIVLLEGFVTISLEILTLRQLTPLVGNSIVITSIIIGIFLLFLAYGYRAGGKHKTDFAYYLQRNFIIAGVGIGIGLSTVFIETFFYGFHFIFSHYSVITLCVYLLLVVSPIVYLLAQTVPITLNLWRKDASISVVGSEVLHLSTIGSFLGATLTAVLLLNFLGVAWTVFVNFLMLVLLVFIINSKDKSSRLVFPLLFVGAFVAWLNIGFEKTIYIATTNYANYQVINDPDQKILVINNSYSSALDKDFKGFPYIEYVKTILFRDLNLRGKKILVLGAGGFTLSAQSDYGNEITYVDIDKSLKKIVNANFLKKINGKFVADDARHFLTTTKNKYDVILNDTYSNYITIAPHLLTLEYYLTIKNSLAENGTAIFNIIANPMLTDDYSKHVDNTLRKAFGNCSTTPFNFGNRLTNIIYVCNIAQNESDPKTYTDNLNSSSLDFFEIG